MLLEEHKTTLEQKIDKYRQILTRAPEDRTVLLALAEASYRRGLRLDALQAYQRVLAEDSVPEAHLAMAQMYAQHGLHTEAFDELVRLMAKEPGNPEAHILAAQLSENHETPENIKAYLERGSTRAEITQARVRLGLHRNMLMREIGELSRVAERSRGEPLHEYYVLQTRNRLGALDYALARLDTLEQAVEQREREESRMRELEQVRLQQFGELELAQPQDEPIAMQEEQSEGGEPPRPPLASPEEWTDAEPDYQPAEEMAAGFSRADLLGGEGTGGGAEDWPEPSLEAETAYPEAEAEPMVSLPDFAVERFDSSEESEADPTPHEFDLSFELPSSEAPAIWEPEVMEESQLSPDDYPLEPDFPEPSTAYEPEPLMPLGLELALPEHLVIIAEPEPQAPPTPHLPDRLALPVAQAPLSPPAALELSPPPAKPPDPPPAPKQLDIPVPAKPIEMEAPVAVKPAAPPPTVAAPAPRPTAPPAAATPPPPPPVPAPAAPAAGAASAGRKEFYTAIAGSIDSLVSTLAKTRGVTSIYVVARDGHLVAQSSRDAIDPARISDMVVEGLLFLEAFAAAPQYWVLECNGGIVVMQTIDQAHVLVAIGQAGANFGALRYTMDKTRPSFAQLLAGAAAS